MLDFLVLLGERVAEALDARANSFFVSVFDMISLCAHMVHRGKEAREENSLTSSVVVVWRRSQTPLVQHMHIRIGLWGVDCQVISLTYVLCRVCGVHTGTGWVLPRRKVHTSGVCSQPGYAEVSRKFDGVIHSNWGCMLRGVARL